MSGLNFTDDQIGTTGTPKGVIISHAAASYGIQYHSLRQKSRWLLFYNPIFSAAQRTILTTLAKGGCLCLASKEMLATRLFETVQTMKVDALGITPSALSMLSPDDAPSCLKMIITVGEPLNDNLVNSWADRVEFRASYGLSECAQLNFSRALQRGDNPRQLGHPSDTTKAYIFEPGTTKELPAGTVGELCLGGPQVSQGYLKRPKETGAAFIIHPSQGIRLYRTGDLALKYSESSFEIVGRLDFQLKINGQRMEPSEVAHVLLRNPEVETAIAIGAKVRGRISLVAVVVPKSGVGWVGLKSVLLRFAQKTLPSYMVPAYWVDLDRLPVTNSGKVDVSGIRSLVESTDPREMLASSVGESTFEGVTDTLEITVRDAWAKVLKMAPEDISRSDSFVALGGSSMDAITVVRELRRNGFVTSLEDIFRSQSLASVKIIQATEADSMKVSPVIPPFSLIESAEVQELFKADNGIVDGWKATPLQEGLLGSTLQGNKDYLYQRTFDIRHLDLVKLKLAFELAFLRNDLLRSTFVSTEKGVFQIVRNDISLPWSESTLSLQEFRLQDREAGVEMGKPYARFAILNSQILVASIHHALFDFWSNKFIFEDVARLYRGDIRIHRLPFKAFVQFLQGQDDAAAAGFWKEYLTGAEPTVLNYLPTPETNQRYRYFKFDVNRAAAMLGVTLGTIVYTAWAMVLCRHTGASEATFATAISGRELPIDGIESMDGPAMSVIPQRIIVDPSATIKNTLQESYSKFWASIKYSQTGIRKALSLSGHQNTRLFDTFVNIRVKDKVNQYPTERVFEIYGKAPVWRTEYTTLDVEEDEEGLHFTLVSPIEEIRLGFILDEFVNALSKLVDIQAGGNLNSSVDILSKQEQHWLSSMSLHKYIEPRNLHSRFELIVQQCPERIAVQWQQLESISYRSLDTRANQLSNYLLSQGFKAGDLIPLLLGKSPTMIVAVLAVLKIGAAYVPLSPENPLERNLYILHEIKATSVLTETAYKTYFPDHETKSICLDEVDVSGYSARKTVIQVKPNQLAYLIFTSGSTGQPKGVMVEHQSAAAAIDSIIEFEGRACQVHRTLQFSNYVFDVSVYDIFVALGSGHILCLAPSDRLLSELAVVINEMQVTHCFLTPTVARLLKPEDVPLLKVLTVGGEAVTADVIATWADGHTLINGYGPTETSILVTMKLIERNGNPRNIGTPLPTVKGYILERDGDRLAPYGAVGELCFSGQQLARGYQNRTDLTEAAFYNSGATSNRIYRTGDLARWLPNGEIECLGRKDNQVKINGHRVELGEIEQTILKASSVKDVVTVVAKLNDKPQLVAVTVLENAKEPGVLSHEKYPSELKEVKKTLTGLTPYMKPKAVIPIGSMPKLPSGKADRKELKKMAESLISTRLADFTFDSGDARGPIIPVETEDQQVLLRAWSKVLNVDVNRLGLQSNFFNLGGDSITAIDLVSNMRKRGYLLTVGDVLTHASLGDMASILQVDQAKESCATQTAFEPPEAIFENMKNLGLAPEEVEYIYPCPPGQAEFLTQGARPEQFWTLMTIRALPKHTNIEHWIRTAEALARENHILRSTFTKHEGTWFGAVLKSAAPVTDHVPITDEGHKVQVIDNIWKSRFKFGEPFIRYSILHLPNNTHEVVIKLDHALYDGTLLRIFASHFKILQHDWNNPKIPTYTSFHNFALHSYHTPKSRALQFFTSPSRRPTPFKYPFPLSSSHQPTITGAVTLTTSLPKLGALSKTTGVTIPIIFQAAFQIWLARGSSSLDIEYDYLYTGRNVDLPDPQSINGTCANFLPLRVKVDRESGIDKYLKDTQSLFWQATENGNVGLGDIYEACSEVKGEGESGGEGEPNTNAARTRAALSNTALFLFQPFEPAAPKTKTKTKSTASTLPLQQGHDDNAANNDDDDDDDPMEWLVMAKSHVTMPLNYALVFEIIKTAAAAGGNAGTYILKLAYDGSVFCQEGQARKVVRDVEGVLRRMVEEGEGGMGGKVGELVDVDVRGG